MSAFPTLPHLTTSTRQPSDGTQVDYGDDGTARVRVMYEATRWNFDLKLGQLDGTDTASLLAHYADNKYTSFSYTWPGDSSEYICVYLECPAPAVSAAYDREDYGVKLSGVAA